MKVWFPVIRGGSGTDIFSRRLVDALRRRSIDAEITWFRSFYQFAPFILRRVSPPSGTQIIHTNSWSGFAFKRPGIPLVVTEHLNIFDPLYRPYKNSMQNLFHETLIRRFERASFQKASAITAVSQSTAHGLKDIVPTYPVKVIYNWVNTETFSPTKPPATAQRPFRLLFVGNFSRRKGADLLAAIMKRLGTTFQLRFTSGLRNIKSRQLTDNMIPLGKITDERKLVETYRECDALLFPSRLEGCSLVALEAMACGKAVIATNVSSVAEVVADGTTGILCPLDDVDAFAAACRKLAEDSQTRSAFGKAARQQAEERFSEERIVPQYVALYKKLAGGRGT